MIIITIKELFQLRSQFFLKLIFLNYLELSYIKLALLAMLNNGKFHIKILENNRVHKKFSFLKCYRIVFPF